MPVTFGPNKHRKPEDPDSDAWHMTCDHKHDCQCVVSGSTLSFPHTNAGRESFIHHCITVWGWMCIGPNVFWCNECWILHQAQTILDEQAITGGKPSNSLKWTQEYHKNRPK